jgi:hypothetical protein
MDIEEKRYLESLLLCSRSSIDLMKEIDEEQGKAPLRVVVVIKRGGYSEIKPQSTKHE